MDEQTPKRQSQDNAASHATETEIEQLYIAKYGSLRAAAFDECPSTSVFEVDAILGRLNRRLHRFKGTLQEFEPWATRYVRLWARHQGVYLHLVTDEDNVRVIQAAIRHELYKSTLDCAVSSEDIYSEIATYLYSHCNGFLSGNQRAKPSTRLYALAKRHIDLYHNKKRRRRIKAVERRLWTGRGFNGAECFSDLELAEMRAIEQAELATA